VWDRLTGNHGPTWLARTSDGGATWEPGHMIYDPGATLQTINNQIVVLPDGTLILALTELANVGPANPLLRILRSIDKGVTWSAPITISDVQTVGTVDPETGTGIRDGSILGSIAAGKNGTLAVTWQDSRFAAGAHDDIAFSRSQDGGFTGPHRCASAVTPACRVHPTAVIRDDGVIGVTTRSPRQHARPNDAVDQLLARELERRRDVAGAHDPRTVRLRDGAAGRRHVFPGRLHGAGERRDDVPAVLRPDDGDPDNRPTFSLARAHRRRGGHAGSNAREDCDRDAARDDARCCATHRRETRRVVASRVQSAARKALF
jgi:hypothetical protein